MIEYIKGDITEIKEGIILHGVNCRGKYASGVAGAIRKKWPSAYDSYMRTFNSFQNKEDILGKIDQHIISQTPHLSIVNCFTQLDYGNDGKMYASGIAIAKCLSEVMQINVPGIDICMPKIGCGLGGLSWEYEVEPIVKRFAHLIKNKNKIKVYYID